MYSEGDPGAGSHKRRTSRAVAFAGLLGVCALAGAVAAVGATVGAAPAGSVGAAKGSVGSR